MTDEEMIKNLKCAIADISEQCELIKAENAALCERLEKAVELLLDPIDYHLEPMVARIVERADSNKVDLCMPFYIYFEFDNKEEAENYLAEWERYMKYVNA